VTLQKQTAWVETEEAGSNTLMGCDREKIVQAALEARPGAESVWPCSDGLVGERVIQALIRLCKG